MLDDSLKAQLQAYLEKLQVPIELTATLDDSAASGDLRALLSDIADLSDKITVGESVSAGVRSPSFTINRKGGELSMRFAAIPLGHEFTSLVLALLWAGGHPPRVSDETVAQIKALEGDFDFEVFMSLTCHNCPDVVQALNLMAVLNPRVKVVTIDGGLFQKEVEERQVMAVPMVFLNGTL
ncbi:MAG: thioredoxin family protein, partial [Betaproteobacteria bacterium]|nr:thioredoxin family protein [Betaproteobacteria bacterium]